jgi:hypothetical protein
MPHALGTRKSNERKESPERVPGLQGHEETTRGEVLDSPTITKTVGRAIQKGVGTLRL